MRRRLVDPSPAARPKASVGRSKLVLAGLALAMGLGLGVAREALARPGGGSSFGGGGGGSHGGGSSSSRSSGSSYRGGSSYRSSSSSGGGGGGGGGDLGPFGVVLMVGAFGLVTVIQVAVAAAKRGDGWFSSMGDWDPTNRQDSPGIVLPSVQPWPKPQHVSLEPLRAHDPNVSQILLEDFLYELYIRAQEARASKEDLALLAPYLDEATRNKLAGRGMRKVLAVSGVIVGAMQITKLELREGWAALEVDYETNYTETYPSGSGHPQQGNKRDLGFYAKERWHFVRQLSAKSRKPDETRGFGCPSCGAPVEQSHTDACSYCGTKHGTGDFDWLCNGIRLEREETRGPALGGYAPEVGTYAATVRHAEVDEELKVLEHLDPAFDRAKLFARVTMIYHALNEAWSSLRWDDARPFLSDRLWLSMRYWIHAYEEQGLQNQMKQAKVDRIEIAKVVMDPFFHAITVRVWASAVDVTVHRKTGAVVGGNPNAPREYSEYWTFIRSAQRRGPASTDAQCPSCGAALSINMAGSCESCGVKITAGQFDWVLSKIEQDEAYRG